VPDLDEQIRELITGVEPVTAAEVIAAHNSSPSTSPANPRFRRPRRMKTYAIGAIAMAAAICVLVVVLVVGVSSSKPTVVTPGRPAGVPASWQRVTYGGLTMYAPGNWSIVTEQTWGDCGTAGQPLFKASAVVLDSGDQGAVYHCPAITSSSSIAPIYGLVLDPGQNGPLAGVSGFEKCLQVNDLSVCPTSTNYGGILVLAVHIHGRAQPVAVEIGLAGGGKVAHTILYSMRASGSKPTSPPTRTTTARSAPWPQRTIVSFDSAYVQNIVATVDSVYWLSQSSTNGDVFTLYRYDLASGHVTKGPSITGYVANSA
jgi:hypothetical protein